MGWDGMGCDMKGPHKMEARDRTGRDEMGWDCTGHDGTGQDGMGWDGMRHGGTGQDGTG